MARAKRHFLPGHVWNLAHRIKDRLGMRAKGRKIHGSEDEYQLREGQSDYGGWQGLDNENTFEWNLANLIAILHIS